MLATAMLLAASLVMAASEQKQDPAAALMEADRAFARAVVERGLDGWLSFFTEDAVRLDLKGAVVQGIDAIRDRDAPLFANPAVRLEWEPDDAGLFAPGDHGFTRGRYRLVQRSEDGTTSVLGTGSYLSLWRRQAEGWKVILDTGAPDQSPHDRDEVYHVLSGRAVLVAGQRRIPVQAGSVAFVAAGVEHRFVDIQEDLSVLVLFAGPQQSGSGAPLP